MKLGIVEDEPETRLRLTEVLTAAGVAVVAACDSGEAMLEILPRVEMEVMLVDLGLPKMSGQELIARISKAYPAIACVAHTVFEEKTTVLAALRAGAAGYLVKGLRPDELVRSLRTLDEGGAPLTARIARLLVTEFHVSDATPLTEREGEVLLVLAEGYGYKEIAATMTVSVHTVHAHVKHIYEKLQVRSRSQAVAKARKEGWLSA